MSHTPGPWRVSPWKDKIEVEVAAAGPFGDRIVLMDKEQISNAALIAAAPELLEALERLWNCAGDFEEDSLAAALDQAAEAIKKAKGDA